MSSLTEITVPPHEVDPILMSRISSCRMFSILFSYFEPTILFKNFVLTSISIKTSGMLPGWPIIWPTMLSDLVNYGSTLVPTAIRPPGIAYIR